MNAKTYWIDPIEDSRWTDLIERHPLSSIFHRPEWLLALQRTYGFTPVVLTTSPPGLPLQNGIALCRVVSWLTGRRLVSLPFSDHCDPLLDSPENGRILRQALQLERDQGGWKYVELRPLDASPPGEIFRESDRFLFHALDLTPPVNEIWRGFHKDCVQRKIRRAERDRIRYGEGRSRIEVEAFYHLQQTTRARHSLPPQPIEWFANLASCLGDRILFRLAWIENQPVAGIVTLRHRDILVYKYGASDARFHPLGVMPFLFWKTIQDAKEKGLVHFDLGRADLDQPGLIRFKEHLGAIPSPLVYRRYPPVKPASEGHFFRKIAEACMARAPQSLTAWMGRRLYRHFA